MKHETTFETQSFPALYTTREKSSKRQDLIQHANGEQINAVSELVLNNLKNRVPVSPLLLAKLGRHKKVLKELSWRKNSIKKRRLHLMNQKGSSFWQGLHEAYCNCFQS